jgi:hypothetical protein
VARETMALVRDRTGLLPPAPARAGGSAPGAGERA